MNKSKQEEIEQDYVIITYKDFADLINNNGLPIYMNSTNNSTLFENIIKIHNIYSYSTFLYHYGPSILKIILKI